MWRKHIFIVNRYNRCRYQFVVCCGSDYLQKQLTKVSVRKGAADYLCVSFLFWDLRPVRFGAPSDFSVPLETSELLRVFWKEIIFSITDIFITCDGLVWNGKSSRPFFPFQPYLTHCGLLFRRRILDAVFDGKRSFFLNARWALRSWFRLLCLKIPASID